MTNVTDLTEFNNMGNPHLCLARLLPHDVAFGESSNWWKFSFSECVNQT